MLFHVRMDVNIPLDMPAETAMKLKQSKKHIRKSYKLKANGDIFGVLQVSTQTSAFLM